MQVLIFKRSMNIVVLDPGHCYLFHKSFIDKTPNRTGGMFDFETILRTNRGQTTYFNANPDVVVVFLRPLS